ncbi:hypothetical protein WJ70_22295 [Burkholderia ubonensis]|nr:hypothetical protein WJ70_22295 [Burkholderia ubonensis]
MLDDGLFRPTVAEARLVYKTMALALVLTPTGAIMTAAEEASKELLFILKALGSRSCTVMDADGIPEIKGAGAYTLWLRLNSGGEMVPTYIGCTPDRSASD